MLRLYMMIVVFGIIGGAIFGAKYYYDSTQATIQRFLQKKQYLILR